MDGLNLLPMLFDFEGMSFVDALPGVKDMICTDDSSFDVPGHEVNAIRHHCRETCIAMFNSCFS